MTDILLVPGAWHDGRAWERTIPLLRDAGHHPVPLDLPATGPSGAGARLHDHTDHLRRSLESSPAPPIVVAHSYAGLVAQQAMASADAPVRCLVLLDAWLGYDGDSMLSLAPIRMADHWRSTRLRTPSGDALPPPPPEAVGVSHPDDVDWLRARLIEQPWQTFADPLRLDGPWLPAAATAIVCAPTPGLPFERWAVDRGIPLIKIGSGHDAMVTVPAELAALIAVLAA